MNSESPAVSIIIPVFNRPRDVISAIESVLAQSFDDYEIVVVDDGSSPPLSLPERLTSPDQLNLVRLPRNRGASAARNAGVASARGRWLAFLDSDDIWHTCKLERQMERMQQLGPASDNAAITCGFAYVDGEAHEDRRIPIAADDPSLFFSGCWFCPGSTVIISRAMFDQVGPYDEDLRRLEDLDWFIRFALAGGRLEVVEEILVSVQISQKSSYERVETAGQFLQHKLDWLACNHRGRRRRLTAYLELEYAASAIKADRNFLLGARHLLGSWLLMPRTTLHLHRYWS